MARQKKFDTDKVLDKAMLLFWQNGYANTSVQDLADTLQIGKGSIYNAFGSKHALFLTTLDRYADSGLSMLRRSLSALPPKEAVSLILNGLIDSVLKDRQGRGCFIINTTTEMGVSDPEVASRIECNHQAQLGCFVEAFSKAARQGSLSKNRDPRALALFFINTMKGLRIMARMKPSRESLQAVVDIALSVID